MKYSQCNDFSFDAALVLLQSTDPYPVNFDTAVDWLGYSNKANARRTLVKSFEMGVDFSSSWRRNPLRGRPSEIINLTVDCFKTFGMMAGTEKGKQVRRYFLECERRLKQVTSNTSFSDSFLLKLVEHRVATRFEERFLAIEDRLERLEAEIGNRLAFDSNFLPMPKNTELQAPEYELAPNLAAIVKRSRRVGAVNARDVSRSILAFRHVSAQEIRSYFRHLEKLGYGRCEGIGTKLKFTAQAQF